MPTVLDALAGLVAWVGVEVVVGVLLAVLVGGTALLVRHSRIPPHG